METTTDLLFLIGMSFFWIHELDAIQQHEWRVLFALLPFSDEANYRLFTAVHAPLFVVMIWYAQTSWFRVGFSVFLVAHAIVHWILRNHPKVTFNNWFSRVWIFGGALLGFVLLVVLA